MRAKAIIGHTPSRSNINKLKKLHLTKLSGNVYTRLFGKHNGRSSFNAAKEALERITAEREIFFNFDEEDTKRARSSYEASRSKKEPKKRTKLFTNEEIIQEWVNIKRLLERDSTIADIKKLQEDGKTRFSVNIYVRRFGNGSFREARKNLNRAVEETDGAETELKPDEEVQIFPPEN